ncbi:MAG TPA: terminase [Novosphingobium capsulatum]|nr:terminase [Novosphingobium capsulatum]
MSPQEVAAARLLAASDFYFFARWMFFQRTGGKWLRADHHAAICRKLTDVFEGRTTRLIINIPPRYSKTELAVVMWIAWCLGKAADAEFIHASYSGLLAANNSAGVLRIVESAEYQAIFPGTRLDSTARSHWKTDAGGVMYSTGAGGTLTGFGAGKEREGFGGAIVIDDPHKADEARSDVMRQSVIDWYQHTLQSRVNSRRTPIILIMQRLHEEDLAGWLLGGGTGEEWEHLCLAAITPEGNALWPEKHTITELRRMERALPYVFAGQYMQAPSPAEGGLFKPDFIRIVDAVPAQRITWVRGWDLAATTNGDFTAGGLLGQMEDGRLIIGDMVRDRLGADERDAMILNTAHRDSAMVKISLPQDPGQAGKTLATHHGRLLAGFNFKTSPDSGSKETRAEPFAAQVNVGNVLMLRGSWNSQLVEEMRMFPNGRHDDQVDALSRAFGELITPQGHKFVFA